MKKNEGIRKEYPKRPFLIYPNKYNELFIILPICFIMFFIKGGGWVYSIIVLVLWFVIAIHWSKQIWIDECERKGRYNIYINGEWVNKPKPHDYHEDGMYHKRDELHYHYFHGKWESREEVLERYREAEEKDPSCKSINEKLLAAYDKDYYEHIRKGK